MRALRKHSSAVISEHLVWQKKHIAKLTIRSILIVSGPSFAFMKIVHHSWNNTSGSFWKTNIKLEERWSVMKKRQKTDSNYNRVDMNRSGIELKLKKAKNSGTKDMLAITWWEQLVYFWKMCYKKDIIKINEDKISYIVMILTICTRETNIYCWRIKSHDCSKSNQLSNIFRKTLITSKIHKR